MLWIGVVFVFAVASQTHPDAFNFHVDLEKYFSHPLHRVVTGTETVYDDGEIMTVRLPEPKSGDS